MGVSTDFLRLKVNPTDTMVSRAVDTMCEVALTVLPMTSQLSKYVVTSTPLHTSTFRTSSASLVETLKAMENLKGSTVNCSLRPLLEGQKLAEARVDWHRPILHSRGPGLPARNAVKDESILELWSLS